MVNGNEKFQFGQKVWVYACPRLLKGVFLNIKFNENGMTIAVIKIDGFGIEFPLNKVFSAEDRNSLIYLMESDFEILRKNLKKLRLNKGTIK